jgi:hypothetical protein
MQLRPVELLAVCLRWQFTQRISHFATSASIRLHAAPRRASLLRSSSFVDWSTMVKIKDARVIRRAIDALALHENCPKPSHEVKSTFAQQTPVPFEIYGGVQCACR